MAFTKATNRAANLHDAIFGPSGAGKTFSALRIAQGLGGRIALIDSERSSASKQLAGAHLIGRRLRVLVHYETGGDGRECAKLTPPKATGADPVERSSVSTTIPPATLGAIDEDIPF